MFKIGSIKDAQSTVVELKHPGSKDAPDLRGKPLGASITVAGPTHPKRKQVTLERKRAIRAEMEANGKLSFDDPETEEAAALEVLIACTLAWDGIADDNGVPLECNPENVRKLYAQTWIRDQVTTALETRANFIESV